MNDQQKTALQALRDTIDFAGEEVRIGTKAYRGMVEDMTFDEVEVAGGVAESGGFRVTVPKEDFSKCPKQLGPIEVRGNKLQILSVIERNGVSYEITAGDPANE